MRAIITRHYKTLTNASGQIMGWSDAPRHNGWRADVDFIDACLREQQIDFDSVYSSNLRRSRQTALFYAKRRGINTIKNNAALNEVDYGRLNRKKKKWVAHHYPRHKKDPNMVYPNGESFRQMQRRSVGYLLALAKAKPQQTILVVVHAGVIRGLVSHFLQLNYADHLKHKVSHRYIGELLFDGSDCIRYNERGEPSGFVTSNEVQVPHECS